MKKLADDCFIHDKDRMTHTEAVKLLKSRMTALTDVETVDLSQGHRRILANAVKAPRNIPAFNNSAVDGYAFSHDEYELNGGFFPITKRIAAGDSDVEDLPGFSAARVFTGAPMPLGADTVAMQEDCELQDAGEKKFVSIPSGLAKGANCRLAGEDVMLGGTVVEAKTTLGAPQLAAIASTGLADIEVTKPLRVALLSSGDEVLRPGETFENGKVYDANHYMLRALLADPSFSVTDLGVCPDEASHLHKLLKDAAANYDVILSTGGASRGEEDHFVTALETLGTCHLWQLAVKPGRPMSFGQISSTPCFTLPGNPVAAFVCFLLYVKPALECLAGGTWNEPDRYPLPAAFSIRSKPDRREFLRGYLVTGEDGETSVQKFERDGSGLISGLTASSGLIEIKEATVSVSRGKLVNFIPFSDFLA